MPMAVRLIILVQERKVIYVAREKYKTLTEQMFYILMCFRKECCGTDVMEKVTFITEGRVTIGPVTLYALLGDFVKQDIIRETAVEGRKRSYIISAKGKQMLEEEYSRLRTLVNDYENCNL